MAAESIIQVDHFTAAYGDHVVVKDLTFEVSRGEVFVILGGSGSGKSTVLKHMIGLYPPYAGDIHLDGRSIVTAEGRERLEILQGIGVIHGGENSLRFTPHFQITSAEIDLIIDAVKDALVNGPKSAAA